MADKFCVTCQHFKRRFLLGDLCLHPYLYEQNPVTGETELREIYTERVTPTAGNIRRIYGLCGPQGQWHEPKN